ncbi:TPA: Rha family transcriptional regulator [Burkholderia cepacia]
MNNGLLSFDPTQPITMSSREIADLTDKEHRNVLRDVRALLDELKLDALSFEHTYKDASNRQQTEYRLPKRETLILVSGYSVQMRARIIDRWQELEATPANRLPTRTEALRLALEQSERADAAEAEAEKQRALKQEWKGYAKELEDDVEQKAAVIQSQAPAVAFHATYTANGEDMGFREVVKFIRMVDPEITEPSFRKFLKNSRIVYKLNGKDTPYASYDAPARGLFRMTMNCAGQKDWKFTAKGAEWIKDLWLRDQSHTRPANSFAQGFAKALSKNLH